MGYAATRWQRILWFHGEPQVFTYHNNGYQVFLYIYYFINKICSSLKKIDKHKSIHIYRDDTEMSSEEYIGHLCAY